jgi:hypothetical protein
VLLTGSLVAWQARPIAAARVLGIAARHAPHYDVVVVGSEPEGIVAAVAAAQEGATVLLATEDHRLGGLFVLGLLNSLDLSDPHQQGLFADWWERVGRGHAFDIARAETAFEAMLSEAGVHVIRDANEIIPIMNGARVAGVSLGSQRIAAAQVIDATADADLAAAADAGFSLGFETIGLKARMADTLVFRVAGVDWDELRRGIRARGPDYAQFDSHVAWGHFGRHPAAYQPAGEGLRLRGLNLGRQEDGTLLVNALLIYGVDPLDPASRAAGLERAAREAPRVVEHLRALPGFGNARFAGTAERLYVRQSRHLQALCELSIDDVLDNRVTSQAVAAGGYPLDVQSLTPDDHGFVYGVPQVFGVELCVTVPHDIDNLWVTGKAAGYDPLAASSARVVPLGMAIAEAAGVAAAWTARDGHTSHEFVMEERLIAQLREHLANRGAYLPEVKPRLPAGPHWSPHYASYRLLLRHGLAVGGYDNDPRLDEKQSAIGLVNLLSNVAERYWADQELRTYLLTAFPDPQAPLAETGALDIISASLCHATRSTLSESCDVTAKRLLEGISSGRNEILTRGQMYDLATAMIRLHTIKAD